MLINGRPDLANVVGWQVPEDGFQAATHYWTDVAPNGDGIIVDADIALSPTTVTSPEILASIITHEWGHAIGLGHSPVADTVMSGPPDSAYTGLTELTPDDVQGCRCLYGPPPGVQAGYSCSLPSKIDFGTVTVGTTSPPRDVEFTNDGSASMILQSFEIPGLQGVDFAFANNQCSPGTTLVPGASCGFKLVCRPHGRRHPQDRGDHQHLGRPLSDPVARGRRSPGRAAAAAAQFRRGLVARSRRIGIRMGNHARASGRRRSSRPGTPTTRAARRWWLTMTAVKSGANTYGGTLFRTTGPAFDATPFDPGQVQRIPVGNGTLTFANADNGTFEYTVNGVTQSKAITRFAFGSMPTCTFGSRGRSRDSPRTSRATGGPRVAGNRDGASTSRTRATPSSSSWFTYDLDGTPVVAVGNRDARSETASTVET